METSATRLADGAEFPLYFAKPGTVKFPHACYLGQVAELPRLTRQADSGKEPKRVPTWGELRLAFHPDNRPDQDNSVAWSEILSPAFNLLHRPLVIKTALKGKPYGEFNIIFQGRISTIGPWADGGVTLTLRNKGKDLEQVLSDYALPASPLVIEDAWDTEVGQALGYCRNVTPKLFATASLYQAPWFPPFVTPAAGYQNRWLLSNAVINRLVQTYYKGAPQAPETFILVQKDVSPAEKNGEGTAEMMTYGPYTGILNAAKWLVVIESITALNSQGASGAEVGLAWFKYSLDDGATWSENFLTWKLAYDPSTLAKSPAVGAGVVAVSGDYTGDCKLTYKIKISRAGDIGDAIPPQFIFSDDNGLTWLPDNSSTWTPIASAPGVSSVTAFNPGDSVLWEITTGGNVGGAVRFKWSNDGGATWTTDVSIPDTNPFELFSGFSVQFTAPGIGGTDDYDAGDAGESSSAVDIPAIESTPVALNRGLSVAFSGSGAWYDDPQWVPAASALGVMSIASIDPGLDAAKLIVEITMSGNVGGNVRFRWNYDGGSYTSNLEIPDTNPIELFTGLSVQFTSPGGPADEYDAGDMWVNIPYYIPAFVVNDAWILGGFKEIPIPLADGVSVQFCKGDRALPGFELYDEFSFILISTMNKDIPFENGDLTCDMEGLISPLTGVYEDLPGALIAALIMANTGWTEADLHLASLAAFDAAMPYQLGFMAQSGQTVAEVINALLVGFPAFYTILLDDRFYLAEITPPVGVAEFVLTNRDLLQLENQSLAADLIWRIFLRYGRNWTPTQNALPNATPERMAWLRQEWRQVSDRDREILQNYPWANDQKPLDTALTERADAKALCRKNLVLYGVPREKQRYDIRNPAIFQRELGVIGQVKRPRFGLDGGELFRLMGLDIDLTGRASAELWR